MFTRIDREIFERIQTHAGNACIGGSSAVRARPSRMGNLSTDQIVGQLGEFSLARWFGDEEAYFDRRRERDKDPFRGDDGYDFGTLPVDVKCSLMRYSKDPKKYRLPVRPRERHEGWLYVAAFAESLEPPVVVYLSGWISDDRLPPMETTGVFEGAHVVPVPQLLPMSILKQSLTDLVTNQ